MVDMVLKNFNNLAVINSIGRICKEDIKYNFIEDKFRIINSKAFRRLEYKTQVFINYTGDHYRTRLTHSLEVSQIAVYIAKELGLNCELAEVIALSHDIGHPPFGHAGEESLNKAAVEYGGFDHNIHAIKIISMLEKYSSKYNGLNLTIDTIDGILKHNGPITNKDKINQLNQILNNYPIKYSNNASLESQIASIADDIAYTKHDLDDGIRAKFINLEELKGLKIFKTKDFQVIENGNYDKEININQFLINLSNFLINDLIQQTIKNVNFNNIDNVEDIYAFNGFILEFSKDTRENFMELKKFLFDNVYKNYLVNRITHKTKIIIKDLFNHFMNNPKTLPKSWQTSEIFNCKNLLSEKVVNYIAGMTDRYAVEEHKKIFDLYYY